MTKRRESEQLQWERIAALVSRCRESITMSLADAQQRFDAAPDLVLPNQFVRSVVSQALYGRAEQLQSVTGHGLGTLLFSADTLARAEVGWVEPPQLVGTERDRLRIDLATVVRSDDLDAADAPELWPACGSMLSPSPTDAVVYEVWADWRGWAHSESRWVRQGTVRSDVYLDGRGLSAQQFSTQHAWWCDSADHRWENRARVRNN